MEKTKQNLLDDILALFADNNAGNISAQNLRENTYNIVDSINGIVSSGDHDIDYPFYNDVRASLAEGAGFFIAESGVKFPNSDNDQIQYDAYPGPGGINHDDLAGRNASIDAHSQYLAVNGERLMEENLPMGPHWINSRGANHDDAGLRFVDNGDFEDIYIGTSGTFMFADNSKIQSGRGVAKAWINFDGSGQGTYGVPVVRSHHNISAIQYLDEGKYKITIPSGVLKDENFAAIGSSNSRTTGAGDADFDRNTVGLVSREKDNEGKVSVTFLVLNDAGRYVDAEINDLIVFGYDENEANQPAPLVIPKL